MRALKAPKALKALKMQALKALKMQALKALKMQALKLLTLTLSLITQQDLMLRYRAPPLAVSFKLSMCPITNNLMTGVLNSSGRVELVQADYLLSRTPPSISCAVLPYYSDFEMQKSHAKSIDHKECKHM
jgi:hypothetical protein